MSRQAILGVEGVVPDDLPIARRTGALRDPL
jgi:hypothetical protein